MWFKHLTRYIRKTYIHLKVKKDICIKVVSFYQEIKKDTFLSHAYRNIEVACKIVCISTSGNFVFSYDSYLKMT